MISRLGLLLMSQYNVSKGQMTRQLLTFVINKPKFRLKFSTQPTIESKNKSSLSKHVKSSVPSSFGKKAKEATKTTYYTAVVIIGIGVLGMLTFALFRELLSSFSPQSVYSAAVDKIGVNQKIRRVFGENIKCYGETSRRGRRQHINHLLYEVDGRKGMRIKFYLQGQFRSGIVYLDARSCSRGWEFRYILAQTDSYPHDIVIVEDNRSSVDNEATEDSNALALFSPEPASLKDS